MGIQSHPSVRSLLDIPAHLEPQLDDTFQVLLSVLLARGAKGCAEDTTKWQCQPSNLSQEGFLPRY